LSASQPAIDQIAWTGDGELRCPVVVFGETANTVGDGEQALGDAGGVSIFVHRYAFDTATEPGREAFWRAYPHTNWFLLASRGPSEDPTWAKLVEPLTRAIDAQSKPVAVALVGDDATARAWAAYGGPKPVIVDAEPQKAVRALVRAFVQAVREA
jgi:hypothetical protein